MLKLSFCCSQCCVHVVIDKIFTSSVVQGEQYEYQQQDKKKYKPQRTKQKEKAFNLYIFVLTMLLEHMPIQSTLVISKSKGLYETLRDMRTSTYQICGNEENN